MDNNKVSFLRYRGSRLDKVKELDAFPKVPENYVQTSPVGGTCKQSFIKNFKKTKII